jgi:hypothetical protein
MKINFYKANNNLNKMNKRKNKMNKKSIINNNNKN